MSFINVFKYTTYPKEKWSLYLDLFRFRLGGAVKRPPLHRSDKFPISKYAVNLEWNHYTLHRYIQVIWCCFWN